MASQIEQVSGEALPITLDDHVMVHPRRRSNVGLLSLFALQYDGQCPEAIATVNGSSKDAKASAYRYGHSRSAIPHLVRTA